MPQQPWFDYRTPHEWGDHSRFAYLAVHVRVRILRELQPLPGFQFAGEFADIITRGWQIHLK